MVCKQCMNKTGSNAGLRIMKVFPKDTLSMHVYVLRLRQNTTAERETRNDVRTQTVNSCVTYISDLTNDAFVSTIHALPTHTQNQMQCLLGYQGISEDFHHTVPPNPPLLSVLSPWRQRG